MSNFFQTISEGLEPAISTHPLRGWEGKVWGVGLAGTFAGSVYGAVKLAREGKGDLAIGLSLLAAVAGGMLLTLLIKEIADKLHHKDNAVEAASCGHNCTEMSGNRYLRYGESSY